MSRASDLVFKMTRTRVEPAVITEELIKSWKLPGIQRNVIVNAKFLQMVEKIKKDSGVIPGMIVLGEFNGEIYLVDAQHRLEAFLATGLKEGYAHLRIKQFDTLEELSAEYVGTNSTIRAFRPDDIMRGLEPQSPPLQAIRRRCPFVGYGTLRHTNSSNAFLSMSLLLRCWDMSKSESAGTRSSSAAQATAEALTLPDAIQCADAANVLAAAWGHDPEVSRLWNGLNLTLCFWIYRRSVLATDEERGTGRHAKRATRLSPELFEKAMMSVSANDHYVDWLVGRNNTDKHRPAAIRKLKLMIAARVELETGTRPLLPNAEWAQGGLPRRDGAAFSVVPEPRMAEAK